MPGPDKPLAGRKPLVLIVDDVPENVQVLGNALRDEPYEIAVATCGQDALSFVVADQPDLILLDINMPGMDGFDVCRRLKKMPVAATIPVIFLTARADTEDVVSGFEVGGVDYITKPFKAAELKARVRTHLQLRQLKSLLSMCSYCNRIHQDDGTWERLDTYIFHKTGTSFSHGICPDCMKKVMPE